jgi:hypothetical protein
MDFYGVTKALVLKVLCEGPDAASRLSRCKGVYSTLL